MDIKNGVSICEGYPNHHRGPHKIYREEIFGAEIRVINGMSICEGSPTYYGGPHNVFLRKKFGISRRQSIGNKGVDPLIYRTTLRLTKSSSTSGV